MKYSEIGDALKEQIIENTYPESIIDSKAKEDAFVHNVIYYKMFYIFMIGNLFGCYMEQIQYYIQRGIWESRAGVIWGPFCEIYGIGAVLIFLLYRKMTESSTVTIFAVSAVCGSTFEYLARLFQEIVFHSITWDYSNQPFNLGGRTSLKYAIYWGLLGLIFIRGIFPILIRRLENIRGRAAFVFTWIIILFMSVNLLCSAAAVNRWNERIQNQPADSSVEEYLDHHYDNDTMKQIFPHLKFMDTTA
ncbi:MAG: hypothetical protein H6Q59_2465 [Firmicutes bacterium]|nr:hypothetical protein [Bacillota bacterium]